MTYEILTPNELEAVPVVFDTAGDLQIEDLPIIYATDRACVDKPTENKTNNFGVVGTPAVLINTNGLLQSLLARLDKQ